MANNRLEKLLNMIAQDPGDIFLTYALGMEYSGMGQLDKAIRCFREVLDKDHAHVAACYQLGKLLDQSGQQQEAIDYFEKGLELALAKKDLKTSNEFRSALDELLY